MKNNICTLIEQLENGNYARLLKDIYVDDLMLDYQKNRYIKALQSFKDLFGDGDIEIYSAPGRSEVGGNHTDHQYGKVLATSINLDAIAVVMPTDDNIIQIKSEGYAMFEVDLSDLSKNQNEEGTSKSLVKGVAYKIKESNYKIGGFKAYITSDVLGGAGMSSSAAFEVLIGNIFSGLYNECSLDATYLAQVGQFAENQYFGKPCGLMDQMASAVGGLIFIDFINPQKPVLDRVNVDFEKFGNSLCIVDTKGSHADLTDEYAAIPYEMKEIASYFKKDVLSQVNKSDFYDSIPQLRERYGDRAVLRAMHLFEENERVQDEVNALLTENFEEFKELVEQSGNSSYKYLQNVNPSKEIRNQNLAIGLAVSEIELKGAGVCRVHGGGFAGTIQAFVPDYMVEKYKEKIEGVFGKDTCYVLKVRKYGGMKVL